MVEAHDEKKPARSRTWIVLSVLIAVIALAVAAAFIVPVFAYLALRQRRALLPAAVAPAAAVQ